MSKRIQKLDFMAPIRTVSEMNQREHWAVRMRRKTDQQLEMRAVMHNVLGGRKIQLPCSVRLTRIGPKALDKDNLAGSFKHVQDAIAKKLGVDDGSSQVTWEYDQMPIGVRNYGVKVEIESIGATK